MNTTKRAVQKLHACTSDHKLIISSFHTFFQIVKPISVVNTKQQCCMMQCLRRVLKRTVWWWWLYLAYLEQHVGARLQKQWNKNGFSRRLTAEW